MRIAELEDMVARRDEELAAGRALNRELMAEINRSRLTLSFERAPDDPTSPTSSVAAPPLRAAESPS